MAPGNPSYARRRARALAPALAVAALIAGCGGGDEPQEGDDGRPVSGPAAAQETLAEAEQRIGELIASGDCESINELNPVSRPNLDSPERCEYLSRLDGREPSGSQALGEAGAVIDYELGDRVLTAVLIRDADGLFHVAFINPFNSKPSAGTKYERGFDAAADDAVRALRKHDCAGFRKLVWMRFGRGAADEEVVCDYVEQNPVGSLLETQPDARLERAGGNRDYALFTLTTANVNYTLVLARQSERGAPDAAAPLPEGAGELALVDAYRTDAGAAG